MEKPQFEEKRVDTTTQEEPSKEGRKRTMQVERLLQDVRENVGAPSNLHR